MLKHSISWMSTLSAGRTACLQRFPAWEPLPCRPLSLQAPVQSWANIPPCVQRFLFFKAHTENTNIGECYPSPSANMHMSYVSPCVQRFPFFESPYWECKHWWMLPQPLGLHAHVYWAYGQPGPSAYMRMHTELMGHPASRLTCTSGMSPLYNGSSVLPNLCTCR